MESEATQLTLGSLKESESSKLDSSTLGLTFELYLMLFGPTQGGQTGKGMYNFLEPQVKKEAWGLTF